MTGDVRQGRSTFVVYLIKPSHYDDDGYVIQWLRNGAFRQWLKHSPSARDYSDLSLSPVDEDEFDALEMFAVTQSAKAAVEKMRSKDEQRARRAAAG